MEAWHEEVIMKVYKRNQMKALLQEGKDQLNLCKFFFKFGIVFRNWVYLNQTIKKIKSKDFFQKK